MNRRVGLAVGVAAMGVIAFVMRQDGLLPEGWTPRRSRGGQEQEEGVTRESQQESAETEMEATMDEVREPRRSVASPHGRLLGPPSLAAVYAADDSVHGRLSGAVEDRLTGVPIAGARLTFRLGQAPFEVRANIDGHFRFDAPAEGTYTLARAEADGYFSYDAESEFGGVTAFASAAGQSLENVRLALDSVRGVRVVVHGQDRVRVASRVRVVAGALADVARDASSGEVFVHGQEDAVLEATTSYPSDPSRVANLGYARLTAAALSTGVLHIWTRAFALLPDRALRGQVMSLLGSEPISGARVSVDSKTSDGEIRVAQLITDSDGHFSYHGPAPGPFSIGVHALGFAAESRTQVTRDEASVLLLNEEAIVEGRVVDDEGVAVPSLSVFAEAHVGDAERHLRAQSRTFSARGEFHLGGLSSGGYTISVAADGFAPVTRDVILSRGQRARIPDVRLRRGVSVAGRVRLPGGAPLANARVRVTSVVDGHGLPLTTDVHSDSAGAFRVDGLSEGQVLVTVSAEGRGTRVVTVQAGGAPVEVTLGERAEGE